MKKLSEEAQGWHDKIIDTYGIDDEAGLLLIQTAMEAFDRMREAQRQLEIDGLTVQDRWKQKKPHPLTTVERDSRAQMVQCLKSLQLDFDVNT